MHERPNTAGVHVRLQQPLLSEIEDFRRSEIDLPTRPEAIRRLLQQAVLARQDAAAATARSPHATPKTRNMPQPRSWEDRLTGREA